MTSYELVFDAFRAKILEDEWSNWTEEETNEDLRMILEGAIPFFKFPRTNLERNEDGFVNDLSPMEIQILASYMKCEWIGRNIHTWENLKSLYDERDFSQANLLDKLGKTLAEERQYAKELQSIYYRSINGKPFEYSKLSTKI